MAAPDVSGAAIVGVSVVQRESHQTQTDMSSGG
jgi:hypothetical protein